MMFDTAEKPINNATTGSVYGSTNDQTEGAPVTGYLMAPQTQQYGMVMGGQPGQPPVFYYPPMYPYTTCCVKPRYLPVQLPGGPALDLPAYDPNGPSRVWSSNLCDCMQSPGVCVEVALCPQAQIVRQASLMWKGQANPCCGWLPLYWILDFVSGFFVTPAIAAELRVRVAQYFHINVADHSDECVKGYFCCLCSLCQTYRELKAQGVDPGVFCTSGGSTQRMVSPIRMK